MSRKSMSRKSVARKSVSRKSMSRKSLSRRQSLSKKGGVEPHPENREPWKKEVEQLSVSDDIWQCHLSVIQEKETAESGIVDLAAQQSSEGNRWPVRVLSMDYIREKVLNHCSKTKEGTAYSALCDAIKEAAGRNFDQEIPVELLAYFIKYEMLEFREIDIERKAEKEKLDQEISDAHLKLDMAAGRKQKDAKGKGRKQSTGRRQSKGGRRQSSKGRRKSAKRQSTKRQSTKRQSTKRQSTKRQSTKRQSTKRQSTKRQSTKRQSTKRQSTKRQSTKRQSTRRQSKKGGRKSVAGGRKSLGGRRKSSMGGKSGRKRSTSGGTLLAAWKKKRQNIKFDTKLNAREMPRKDVRYVEDFPVEGPNAYFVITQLRNPNLPKALRELGLPVDSVIMYDDPRIARDDEKPTAKKLEEYRDLLDELERDYLFKKSDKRQFFELLKEKYAEQGKLGEFWKEFMHQALTQENRKLFENTIMTKYRPDLKNVPLKSESRKEEMKEIFYEELCMLMYFMGRISELYKRYNASVKLFEVESSKTTTPEELEIYKTMMDCMPNEVCDVPIILDTLLHQVSHNMGEDTLSNLESYGWKQLAFQFQSSTTGLEEHLHSLEIEYDLVEADKKKPKIIRYPRTILNGDLIKWKTIHLGKLGKYVRDRTCLMQKTFLDAVAWSKVEIDTATRVAHDAHLERYRNALGIRYNEEIADWLIALSHLCAMDLPKLWKNDNLVFFHEGPVLTFMKDNDLTSTKTLIGSLTCSLSSCSCMEMLCDVRGHSKIISELDYLNNIRNMPDYLIYQTIYDLYSDRDVVKKEYNQLLDSIVYQFYNGFSTFNVRSRIETPVSLKNFYQHILKEKKQWCLKELNSVAEDDPPKFFKPRMDLLMAHLDTITTPVEVSDNLSLTYKDFIDPHSMREEELEKEEEKLKELQKEKSKQTSDKKSKKSRTSMAPTIDPIAAAISQVTKPVIGYVYGLDEDQKAVFHERRKNFVLGGGSRLNLKFDESIYGKPLVMIKLRQNGHTLIFHTPLYQHYNLINFTFEHENGIMMSFTERIWMKDDEPGTVVKRRASKTSLARASKASRGSKTSHTRRKIKRASLASTVFIPKSSPSVDDPDKEKFTTMEKKRLVAVFQENTTNFKEKVFKKIQNRCDLYEMCDCIMTLLKSRVSLTPRPFSYHKYGCGFRKEKYESNYIHKYVSEPFNDPELFDSGTEQILELDLQLSYPTGLHVSVLRQPKIGGVYVKQEYLSEKNEIEEKYRFVVFNGTVIKYMKNGEIEIYYPWGTIVTIQDVSWSESEVIEPDALTEIVMPREIIFSRYVSLSPDGKHVDHSYGSTKESPTEYMEETDDLFCNTRTVERSDGTKFLYDENGTLIARFPDGTEIRSECGFKPYEYFVNWSEREMDMWFGSDEEEEIEEEEYVEEEEIKKISYSKDGFVIIEIWSYSIHHPYMASVTTGCVEKKILNLYLPGDTCIQISDKSLYKILIGQNKEFRFKVGTDKLILDSIKNDRLYQRSVLNYVLMRKKVDQADPKTLFMTRTNDFTDLKMDSNGEIKYRILPEREDAYNLAKGTFDKRQFLIKNDNSGIEILSKNYVESLVKNVEKIPGSKLDRIRPSTFTETIMFHPVDNIVDYWKMDYPHIKTNNRYVIPSTYGTTYLFPFQLAKTPEKEATTMIMNLLKKVEFVDKKRTFLESVDVYKEFVMRNEIGQSCDCYVDVLTDDVKGREDATLCRHLLDRNYRHSTTTGKYFSRYIYKKIVPQILRTASKKLYVTQNFKTVRYYLQRVNDRSSPVYFESGRGAVFYILQQIIKTAEEIIFDIHRCEEIEELIDKPMHELSDAMVLDLAKCIKPVEMGLGEITKQEVRDVLTSAKKLHEYFPNMREAIEYRKYAIVLKGRPFDEIDCKAYQQFKIGHPRKYQLPLPDIVDRSESKVNTDFPSFAISDVNTRLSLFEVFEMFLKRNVHEETSEDETESKSTAIEQKRKSSVSIEGFGHVEQCDWVNLRFSKNKEPQEFGGHIFEFFGFKPKVPDVLMHLNMKKFKPRNEDAEEEISMKFSAFENVNKKRSDDT